MEERLASGGFKVGQKKDTQLQLEKVQAYKGLPDVPKDVVKNQIYVDMKNDAVILPIYGDMVVFHISVVKNVSKHDEGPTSSIRFNFHVPGSTVTNANIVFPTYNKAPVYIKELTFRSQDVKKLNENLKKIKEL
jgi:nucleosome binding factor SPN SPT16 subunit